MSRSKTPERSAIDAHALDVLEFPRVLELIAGLAVSEAGADRVRRLVPSTDPAAVGQALEELEELLGLLGPGDRWMPPPIPSVGPALRRLRTADAILEAEALGEIQLLLSSSRSASEGLNDALAPDALLRGRVDQLVRAPELEERLSRSLEPGGGVADAASSELRRLRSELRSRRSSAVERLETYARGLEKRYRVPDGSVTVRGGRYCVPIRREGRRTVGGIVHDESATGQTLFVEPPDAIEPMNAIRELETSEAREIRRILRELTDALRPRAEELDRSYDALRDLDALYARGRYALECRAAIPEISGDPGRRTYRVTDGRHPLLLAGDEPAVPFELSLDAGESVMLVSGPNAGGKTVLLKSIGLFSAMAQSGILPPTGPGTRLPIFRRFFAMIGDEQSIEASLSTFGAQVAHLREIVEESGAQSLVLLDEIGANTDPAEGAALAAAVLIELSGREGLTVATTHLGALKGLASETESIVNASLQFDSEQLRPTFSLVRDRPGRSYALEIAGRLGLPERLLEEARARLGGGGQALEKLLADLEDRHREMDRLVVELEDRMAAVEPLEVELAGRAAELERREVELERAARETAERYLFDARERVEEAIDRLRGEYATAAESDAGPAGAETRARSEIERALRETRGRKPKKLRREPVSVAEGGWVVFRATGKVMRVREVRGDRVTVEGDGLRITVQADALEASEAPTRTGGAGGSRRATREVESEERRPELTPRMEVDLRGLRVEEVGPILVPALDAAIFADLPRLRIIHGKGTGAVRARVRELLKSDSRTPRFRAGEADEGGAGVTVVEFDEATDDER